VSQLRDLYQEVIIDHGRHPRNFGILSQANFTKEGFNPLCGDRVCLYILKTAVLDDIKFEGAGCAISMASASLMTEVLKGKTPDEIDKIFEDFHLLVTTGKCPNEVGKLASLAGVSEFPARVKCATLAWHTLKAALAGDQHVVSTE